MFDAVFFDLDGTLVDTARDFERAINGLLRADGLPTLGYDAIRTQVSNGARALTRLAFGLDAGDSGFDARLSDLLDAYEASISADSCLFPGTDTVLERLEANAIPWGVVTNKPQRFTRPVLAALRLDQRSVATICPDDVSERKPNPEGLLLAARLAGVDAKRCLYVGDHERDIAAGRNAGMTTACALYGYIGADESPEDWQADYLLQQPKDLLPLITPANNAELS